MSAVAWALSWCSSIEMVVSGLPTLVLQLVRLEVSPVFMLVLQPVKGSALL